MKNIVSQTISLQQGWNIISTYIDPENDDIFSIFSGVMEDLIIVKNQEGAVAWPEFDLNSILNF